MFKCERILGNFWSTHGAARRSTGLECSTVCSGKGGDTVRQVSPGAPQVGVFFCQYAAKHLSKHINVEKQFAVTVRSAFTWDREWGEV